MVYVDDYRGRLGRMVMCHLLSDTSVDELHAFADRIGLRRAWFQTPEKCPHYDVSLGKRAAAVAAGAVHLPIRVGGEPNPEWLRVRQAARALRTA